MNLEEGTAELDIELVKGLDDEVDLFFSASTGEVMTLTGYTFIFERLLDDGTVSEILSIALGTVVVTPLEGKVTLKFTSAITNTLGYGSFSYHLRHTVNSLKNRFVKGKLKVVK